MCSINFWHQHDSNSLFEGSIGHVTSQCKWPIDLFHNGGLLMYSFKYMIISLSDLVWKKVFLCIFQMLTRLERPIIIRIKEYINSSPLWKRSIHFLSDVLVAVASLDVKVLNNTTADNVANLLIFFLYSGRLAQDDCFRLAKWRWVLK